MYRLFEIQIPFKSLIYFISKDYYYILLECNSLPKDFNHFNENLFRISNVKEFLTSFRFHSFVHMDNNEKVINISNFHYYHAVFLKDFKANNSNLYSHLFRDMEDFHLKLFCLQFVKNSLKLSEGKFIMFYVSNSDCFLKRFLNFLPEPLKGNLTTFLEENYRTHAGEFLEFLLKLVKLKVLYDDESDTFVLLDVEWAE